MRLSRNTKSISAAVVYSRGGYAAVQKSAFLMFYMRSYAKPNCKKIGFSKYKFRKKVKLLYFTTNDLV